ncbi:MAG: RnfABCDGE type electron transport complex subunit D [Bacilli bacterium]
MNSSQTARPAPNPLLVFLKTPKGYAMAALIGLTLIAALRPQDHLGLLSAAVAVATGLAIDGGVALLQRRKKLFSDGAVITALIVADVLSHATPLYIVAATTAVALLSKHLLKVGRKPLFNPAAFGLLFAIVAFNTGQSWWGSLALLPTWLMLLLLAAGLLITVRVNKFPQVASFLGAYFALLLAMAIFHLGLPSDTPGDALRAPFVNSALYLAFFMVTDPPTSPAPYRQQVMFGMIVAVVGTLIFATSGGLAYLLVGLLVGNAWKAVLQWTVKAAERRIASPAKKSAVAIRTGEGSSDQNLA